MFGLGFFFSFGSFLLSVVLFLNAVLILNEDRFLSRFGWSINSISEFDRMNDASIKNKLIYSLKVIQYLRVPMIVINGVVIILQLIFG
ncbi:hypothetical protein M0813_15452 [Anaeramoeba flamelloides]|uniref:Yos1-like protein n=1 Tax=Anaeramoeba flamelloides TaxID=1746091 RepID=A0AAV8A894_9EUKA|nr:hypothetical protein M0812_06514 [Anaeramoeba flamelloides]KAJ6250641.1 hypothetical protein M0813_15452 [Anaeramoeba flamelloides]